MIYTDNYNRIKNMKKDKIEEIIKQLEEVLIYCDSNKKIDKEQNKEILKEVIERFKEEIKEWKKF